MRRQQLRRAVKRVFSGQVGGGDWVESKQTSGSILKKFHLLQVATSLDLGS